MGAMDNGLQEVCGNKLELVSSLVDSYHLEIGHQMESILIESNQASLTHLIVLFIPCGYLSPHNFPIQGKQRRR